jgi:glycosyltransferase involved in cell wall biosynthesis
MLNFIQDIATPHNNVLIRELVHDGRRSIRLWYAKEEDASLYSWKENLSHKYIQASIYGTRLNLKFLWYCITHREEKYLIVGWANINTKLLHLIFFFLRRPFNHWTDLPDQNSSTLTVKKRIIRYLAYRLLKRSKGKIFGVGKTTVNLFKKWGFPESRIVNFPIFVDVDDDLTGYRAQEQEMRSRYGILRSDFVISAGSRIVFEKGYDLFLRSIASIRPLERSLIKVVLVGKGEQLQEVKELANQLKISDQVIFVDWLSIDDFKALIVNSDLFVHPARFDSYGGTTLAMALGVPVIGSKTAGAAYDRIEHGINGFLYDAEDFKELARLITQVFSDRNLRMSMANAARRTAMLWHPKHGAHILINELV